MKYNFLDWGLIREGGLIDHLRYNNFENSNAMICYAMLLLCCYVLFVFIFSTGRHVIKLKVMNLLNLTNIVPDMASSVALRCNSVAYYTTREIVQMNML